ncbi:receptor-like protein EIX1 [Quercus suber]|nr:receptor-like protein EIX1 [Quercus suber]
MALTGAVPCMDSEQDALLKIKEGFKDVSEPFSSWTAEEDCCNWRGVGCDNTTGHVTMLDLHSRDPTSKLPGEVSPSLLDLPYLRSLDLSLNHFQQTLIPEFICSLKYIEHLNLSNANFRGTIPSSLGNLSHLKSLDLSGNGLFYLRAENLSWVYGLSSLEVLALGGVEISNAEDWLDAVNMLPSLVELRLFFCNLHKLPQNLHHVNFTTLKILDLSLNNFSSTIPDWLFDIGHSLVYLNLSRCQLHGVIPNAFGNLTSLISLDLSDNNLEGPIPLTLGLFQEQGERNRSSSLRKLYLSSNGLNGSLARSLAQFSQLAVLDVARNYMKGSIKEAHLQKFSSLRVLDLSSNRLALKVSSNWTPPFQLETIGLRSCLLGPKFPQWLRSQNNFSAIDISNASIVDVVPDWFWNLSSRIMYMNLSFNKLKGHVPDFSSQHQLSELDLTGNNFSSPLPRFSANTRILFLAKNSFFGHISNLCRILSINNSLNYLDLSSNNLWGEIPDCWKYGHNLIALNLANNNLSGQIPNSTGQLIRLNTLRLENNILSGEVPLSLKTCTELAAFHLANNRLLGNVPTWIGENLQKLKFLSLCSNSFSGNIPRQLCQLQFLNYLNLSSNSLSGAIPPCTFPGMMTAYFDTNPDMSYPYMAYSDSVKLTFSSREFIRYSKFYHGQLFFNVLDLSSNNLSGRIPTEVMSLDGLIFLNLSRNHLVGPIPPNIEMPNLEALDLSRNYLSCTMPSSISSLTFLSLLDISNNNLSGKIPLSTQLQSFSGQAFIGNPQLCGPPLSDNCSSNESFGDPHCSIEEGDDEKQGIQKQEQHDFKIPSFYLSIGLGFIVGYCGFWGSLLLNKSWRYSYFRFLGNMNDKIYVMVAAGAAKLKRKFQHQQAPK